MKKGLIYICFHCLVFAASAQQYPQFSQYLLNNYLINPAAGGVTPCLDLRSGHRQQWVGFEGAPYTSFLSGHTSINQNTFRNGWHGVGGYIFYDSQGGKKDDSGKQLGGKIVNIEVHGSYAYHLRLTQDYSLSFGASLGVKQFSVQGYTGILDPAISDSRKSVFVLPDIAAGIWLRSLDNFVGLSVKQIAKRRAKFGNDVIGSDGSKLVPHYFLTLGKRIESSAYYYTFIPSAQLRMTAFYPPSLDLNFMWLIKDKVGLGAGYRVVDAVNLQVQYQLTKRIRIGYAVEYVTSRLGVGSPYMTSHEFILSYKRCGSGDDGDGPARATHCPAYE